MKLTKITKFLDELLGNEKTEDPYTKNGLQVQGKEDVKKIGFAVDACMESFNELKVCDMIVVHHGLFWPSIDKVTGNNCERLRFLLDNQISLYSSHIPLDVHSQIGNNAIMMDIIGAKKKYFKGFVCFGEYEKVKDINQIKKKIDERINPASVMLPFGKKEIKKVSVCSGGGYSLIGTAVDEGADLYITGEGSHTIYHYAKESRINIILAGHYKTETLGIRKLMEVAGKKLNIETVFTDIPTGF